eukprot:3570897-Prymnesium_polylepis.1
MAENQWFLSKVRRNHYNRKIGSIVASRQPSRQASHRLVQTCAASLVRSVVIMSPPSSTTFSRTLCCRASSHVVRRDCAVSA